MLTAEGLGLSLGFRGGVEGNCGVIAGTRTRTESYIGVVAFRAYLNPKSM